MRLFLSWKNKEQRISAQQSTAEFRLKFGSFVAKIHTARAQSRMSACVCAKERLSAKQSRNSKPMLTPGPSHSPFGFTICAFSSRLPHHKQIASCHTYGHGHGHLGIYSLRGRQRRRSQPKSLQIRLAVHMALVICTCDLMSRAHIDQDSPQQCVIKKRLTVHLLIEDWEGEKSQKIKRDLRGK